MNPALAERLVGFAEIAELAGVSKNAVSKWWARYPDFQECAVTELTMGIVCDRGQVLRWLKRTGRLNNGVPH